MVGKFLVDARRYCGGLTEEHSISVHSVSNSFLSCKMVQKWVWPSMTYVDDGEKKIFILYSKQPMEIIGDHLPTKSPIELKRNSFNIISQSCNRETNTYEATFL